MSETNHEREDERGSSGLDDPESHQGGGLDAGEQVHLVNHGSNNDHIKVFQALRAHDVDSFTPCRVERGAGMHGQAGAC